MLRQTNNRRIRRRPRGNGGVVIPRIFPAGSQQYTVRSRVFIDSTRPEGTSLYAGTYRFNPYSVVFGSFSQPLIFMFTRFRLNSYSVKAYVNNVSTATAGNFYSVLLRDSTTSPPLTNNYISWIYNQQGHRTTRTWNTHRHSWLPVEAADYNWQDFSAEEGYDFGTIYLAADIPETRFAGGFYLDIVMNLSVLNRRAPNSSIGVSKDSGDNFELLDSFK
jgi:hypothetical protein